MHIACKAIRTSSLDIRVSFCKIMCRKSIDVIRRYSVHRALSVIPLKQTSIHPGLAYQSEWIVLDLYSYASAYMHVASKIWSACNYTVPYTTYDMSAHKSSGVESNRQIVSLLTTCTSIDSPITLTQRRARRTRAASAPSSSPR